MVKKRSLWGIVPGLFRKVLPGNRYPLPTYQKAPARWWVSVCVGPGPRFRKGPMSHVTAHPPGRTQKPSPPPNSNTINNATPPTPLWKVGQFHTYHHMAHTEPPRGELGEVEQSIKPAVPPWGAGGEGRGRSPLGGGCTREDARGVSSEYRR